MLKLFSASAAMPPKVRKDWLKRGRRKATNSRLDVFARGVIWGMHLAKAPRADIQKLALKKDGAQPQLNAIDKVIAHKTEDPEWRGEDSSAGGRPCALTSKQQKLLTKLVFKERGRAVVTVSYCRKRLPYLRKVSVWCVSRALGRAGLAWLTRRRKCWVIGSAPKVCVVACSRVAAGLKGLAVSPGLHPEPSFQVLHTRCS